MRPFSVFNLIFLVLMSFSLANLSMAEEEEAAEETTVASRYIEMKPAFVANYGGAGKLRYLKTDITLRVSEGDVGENRVFHHMPQLRHAIVMLLSRQSDENLSSMEGKELLRQQALTAVGEVLVKEENANNIEDLLFTNFIIQR